MIYHIISNERRRHVLRLFQTESNREVYLRELAERVAAWENETSVESVTTQERRRTETALRQFHLPKMAEAGFVHYDARRKTARLAVPPETYADYLDPGSEPNRAPRPWHVFTSAVGLVSIAVFALPVFTPVGADVVTAYPLLLGVLLLLAGTAGSVRRLLVGTGSE